VTDDYDAWTSVAGASSHYVNKGDTNGSRQVGIELVWIDASNVIGLDDLV
jgi:hypothetical protein